MLNSTIKLVQAPCAIIQGGRTASLCKLACVPAGDTKKVSNSACVATWRFSTNATTSEKRESCRPPRKMSLKLSACDADLNDYLRVLLTFEDVADLLEVKGTTLAYYLYRANNYKVFRIRKRSGGERVIHSPSTPLKIIQRKLNQVLHAAYVGRSPAHGCVRGKSIVTNARSHLGQKLILNFDLADFFPSIHFGRVLGLFAGKPYNLPHVVALTFARICCNQGVLPAGAPTSPVVANMICAQLDSQLKTLAREARCFYTRYVDDITISIREKRFPDQVVHKDRVKKTWVIGDAVQSIVRSNGFQIQSSKTRVLPRSYRQEVTGLVLSERLNVKRHFTRQVRAMLHAWKRWGLEGATAEFHKKYDRKQRQVGSPDFKRVVRGKIEFIGAVRGRDNIPYLNLIHRYCQLDDQATLPCVVASEDASTDVLAHAIWLLEEEDGSAQGTAFAAAGYSILTADHVVEQPAQARQPWAGNMHYPAQVTGRNKLCDVARVKLDVPLRVQLSIGSSDALQVGDELRLLALPKYTEGDGVKHTRVRITGKRRIVGSSIDHFSVDSTIIFGSSGGPILNSKNEVVGIAVRGQDLPGREEDISCFVPISDVVRLM